MSNIFLVSGFLEQFGIFNGITTEGAFWTCFIIAAVCYGAYIGLAEEMPWVALASNLVGASTLLVYIQFDGDPYWFLEWGDGEHWFRWIVCLFLTAVFIGMCFRTSWEHIRLLGVLFSAPITALIGLVIGIVWFGVAMYMIAPLAVYHTFAFILILLGAISSGSSAHVPTIYVQGEGHITGHGYHGGDRFHGDNGNDYRYDGSDWHRS